MYIQLTLLHISAEVIHGNSLSFEVFRTWYTPAYIMNAASRQDLGRALVESEELVMVRVPDDAIENKLLYSDKELEVFASGRASFVFMESLYFLLCLIYFTL